MSDLTSRFNKIIIIIKTIIVLIALLLIEGLIETLLSGVAQMVSSNLTTTNYVNGVIEVIHGIQIIEIIAVILLSIYLLFSIYLIKG